MEGSYVADIGTKTRTVVPKFFPFYLLSSPSVEPHCCLGVGLCPDGVRLQSDLWPFCDLVTGSRDCFANTERRFTLGVAHDLPPKSVQVIL
jgi:hypothetical protein